MKMRNNKLPKALVTVLVICLLLKAAVSGPLTLIWLWNNLLDIGHNLTNLIRAYTVLYHRIHNLYYHLFLAHIFGRSIISAF